MTSTQLTTSKQLLDTPCIQRAESLGGKDRHRAVYKHMTQLAPACHPVPFNESLKAPLPS